MPCPNELRSAEAAPPTTLGIAGDEETRSPLTRPVNMLLRFVAALVLVDTVFFTALTPRLPHHTHTAHLSQVGSRHPRRRLPLSTSQPAQGAGR